MTAIENLVIETWRIHIHVTIFVLEHIPDEALKATLSKRAEEILEGSLHT